jgi:hypothetical protein
MSRTLRPFPHTSSWHMIRQSESFTSIFIKRVPRYKGVVGEWRYNSTHSLTSAIDGGEWSASRPGRSTPKEISPGTHWIGGLN